MVKHLRHCLKIVKLFFLMLVLAMIAAAIWLHASERSLNFAKPWILSSLNPPDAPYAISFSDVTMDWHNAVELGQLRISNVAFAKKDGNVFAQLPEVYATIDPIGFLPTRRILHTVTLHGPRLFLTRSEKGEFELGFEGAPARLPLNELMKAQQDEPSENKMPLPELPFHDFVVDGASFTFTDAASDTTLVSSPISAHLTRHGHYYDASLAMPFRLDNKPVLFGVTLKTTRDHDDHLMNLEIKQFPPKLVCILGFCLPKVNADGLVDALLVQRVTEDEKFGLTKFGIRTKGATLDAPEWFADPVKFGATGVVGSIDWNGPKISITQATLAFPDTSIKASGVAEQKADGWYVNGEGSATRLDVKNVYKYWPLFLAPDSRAWVVSKLKSGYAESGSLKFNFLPIDINGTGVRDEAVDATADARDITFEYLPGFPPVEHMNGIAHFTGKTVRVEGGGGSLLSGTNISKAVLWCPELDNPKNPMEAEVEASAPATDAAQLLSLKFFTFDDALELNPATIKGSGDLAMKLKFDAFSGKAVKDPNEIHLEGVIYDISAKLHDIAQDKLGGIYNAHDINGELKASNAGMELNGSLGIADAGMSDVILSQKDGKPLNLTVKSRPGQQGAANNDFALSYEHGADGPIIAVKGKSLDASVSYGKSDNSILSDFPAMHLSADLDQLILAAQTPFTDVIAKLDCNAARCESADFKAKIGAVPVRGGITRLNGQRRFNLASNDAGSFIRALAISDRMSRGKLVMSGNYDDSKTPPELKAHLTITDFTMKNSEILGRIFAIGSLTGLQNALTGSGISFDKMNADIAERAGVITLDKGIANGTAIGITATGTIDSNSTKMNLKGVVVPAYALNSAFGKIPIIGKLMGGEGEGLIAFNYSVRGTADNPDVGVNPLSGLTPGFLRGIFTIFDEKTPTIKDSAPGKKQPDDSIFNPARRLTGG